MLNVLAVIVAAGLAGAILTLLLQYWILKKWIAKQPITENTHRPQYTDTSLPKELQDMLKNPDELHKKEVSLAVNLVFQFLFQELRDTKRVKRWVEQRMRMEFAELLQTTTGKLLDQISVRGFNLGETFPVIEQSAIENVSTSHDCTVLEELAVVLDITYGGGFQLAVDVDLVFGRSAFLSVRLTKLIGSARLHFTRNPYTHWTFTFTKEPVMEFEVESKFEGKTLPQVTSLIVNQIRRSIRKKHTLPNYKIRYKPFFQKPQPVVHTKDVYYHGRKLSEGSLMLTVVKCTRLSLPSADGQVYVTVALDSKPWTDLASSYSKFWISHQIDLKKIAGEHIGITFKEEYLMDRYENCVVVDLVTVNSSAQGADVRKGDIILTVDGFKVSSTKQVIRLIKQAQDRVMLKVHRCTSLEHVSSNKEFKVEEDSTSLQNGEPVSFVNSNTSEFDDFINISIATNTPTPSSSLCNQDVIKQGNTAIPEKQPAYSTGNTPEKKRTISYNEKSPKKAEKQDGKVEGSLSTPARMDPSKKKKRSKSDVGLILKDKEKLQQMADNSDSISLGGAEDAAKVEVGIDEEEEIVSASMRRTQLASMSEGVINFNEAFQLDLEENDAFINMCVFCHMPEKRDKQGRMIKSARDVLLGHITLSTMDVALECLGTLQGDTQRTYTLVPSDAAQTNKRPSGQNKANQISSHPGYDSKLGHGDITAAFLHKTQPLSNTERQRILRIRQRNETNANDQAQGIISKGNNEQETSPSGENKHDFASTHFTTSTYCNFCHKKIWLKTAYQCQLCRMVCHKKCMERCQIQATCSRSSLQSNADFTVGDKSTKVMKEKIKEGRSHSRSPLPDSGQEEVSSTTGEYLGDRKRHYSAPNDDGIVAPPPILADESAKLLVGQEIPRTRSTTSLQELLQVNAAPALQPSERTLSSNESQSDDSDSEDDDDMNLVRFCQRQKGMASADEAVVTAAKQMGRKLYADLEPEQRKDKLDAMITKLQQEIDDESLSRTEIAKLEQDARGARKIALQNQAERSEARIESLAMLMLHYCAGLQHCLEEEEVDRQNLEEMESKQQKITTAKDEDITQTSDSDQTMKVMYHSAEDTNFNEGTEMQMKESIELKHSSESVISSAVITAEDNVDSAADEPVYHAANNNSAAPSLSTIETTAVANDSESDDEQYKELCVSSQSLSPQKPTLSSDKYSVEETEA